MKKYLCFFKIRFINGLQYRAAAFAGILTQFAWGAMRLLMFWAFYQNNENIFPMGFSSLSSYIWLQQALLAMFTAWYFDNDIFSSITGGNIAYELCRPVDLYNMWFTKNMAVRISRTVLRCFPVVSVAALLPEPFNISLPYTVLSGAMFLLSLFLGFLVLIAFGMLVYISAFYTVSPAGSRILATSVTEFFSGAVIPLPFFPDSIKGAVSCLPFASVSNTPFLIYTGYLSGTEAFHSIVLQLFWLAALVASGKLLMKKALKRIVVQGG